MESKQTDLNVSIAFERKRWDNLHFNRKRTKCLLHSDSKCWQHYFHPKISKVFIVLLLGSDTPFWCVWTKWLPAWSLWSFKLLSVMSQVEDAWPKCSYKVPWLHFVPGSHVAFSSILSWAILNFTLSKRTYLCVCFNISWSRDIFLKVVKWIISIITNRVVAML